MPYSFTKKIRDHVASQQKVFRYFGPTPTNMATCPKLIYHQIHDSGQLRAPGYELGLKFREGNSQEPLMVDLIQESHPGIKIVERNTKNLVTTIGRHQVKGRPDGLIHDSTLPRNTMPMIEFKSMDEHNFMRFMAFGLEESHPYYYDQIQTTLLLVIVNFPKITVPYAVIFSKLRGSEVDIWDEQIEFSEDHIRILEERLDERDMMLAKPYAPERPYERGHIMCKNCPAEHLSWGGREFEVADENLPTIDNLDELVSMAKRMVGFLEAEKLAKNQINLLRSYFDNQLSKWQRRDIPIALQDLARTTLTPYLRTFDKNTFNQQVVRLEDPKLGQKASGLESVTQLRFKVIQDGKVVRN